jgi:hypothetical protein
MPGNPNVAEGVEVDPVSIGGQTIIKVGSIFISTIPLRTARILLNTGANGTSPARGIADFRRRKIPSGARRDHKNHGNNPEAFFHICSPLIKTRLCKLCANSFSLFPLSFHECDLLSKP